MSAKTINRISSARCPWSEPPPPSSAITTATLATTSKNNRTTNIQTYSLAPAREYAASLRRGLFRKREWMQTTLTKDELTGSCGADSDGGGTVHGGGGDSTHSTPPPRIHPSTSMDDSSIGSPQPQLTTLAPKKGGKSSTNKSSGAAGRLFGLLKGVTK